MTTTCLGDTHEHPLFQTHRLCRRSRYEWLGFWRPRISLRAAVSPEHVSDRFRQGNRCASVAELTWIAFVFRSAVKPSMAAPGETPVSHGPENKHRFTEWRGTRLRFLSQAPA